MYKSRFINYLTHEKRYSAHTVTAYDREIDGFLAFTTREQVEFSEVDHKLARYYFSLLKEEGKAATSINRAISALRSYYKFLQRENLVKSNPIKFVHALKTPKKLPVVVEKEKMTQLLAQWDNTDNNFENYRNFIVMELLFGTGIRLSELLHI